MPAALVIVGAAPVVVAGVFVRPEVVAPPIMTPPVVVAVAAVIEPVHKAPMGQQATFLPLSTLHVLPTVQHAPP
jgi:hypothetical protein